MNSNLHKKIVTQYFIAAFASVLMLLSSCTVKQNLDELFGVQYEKPLNPNKSAAQSTFSSCSFTDIRSSITQVRKNKTLIPFVPSAAHPANDLSERHPSNSIQQQRFITAVKVPFYILYKKLKYDIA